MKKATGAGGRRKRAGPANAKKPNTSKKPKTPQKPKKANPKTPTRAKQLGRSKGTKKSTNAKRPTKASVAEKPSLAPAAPEFEVRELDPVRKCGPDTSVEELYRVDERTNGHVRTHLVFLDRHGWYCEHGRECPAVEPARKTGSHARHTGPTHNGRMRA